MVCVQDGRTGRGVVCVLDGTGWTGRGVVCILQAVCCNTDNCTAISVPIIALLIMRDISIDYSQGG